MRPRADAFAADVRSGLTSIPKHIEPQYFYDALGSALFAAICELPEYYVTRAEREILDAHADEIARAFGQVARVVELGSGNARKTQRLMEAILARQPQLLYQPVDVDAELLEATARELEVRFPTLVVDALCGEYHDVTSLGTNTARTVLLFLGSSIGNLDHGSAAALLRDTRRILAPGDALFVGFDLKKEKPILDAAYNDALGVTASFNLNLLARINRELGGTFELESFTHRAHFNEAESRIEMHLASRKRQSVRIESLQLKVDFEDGEMIHTENSYKYDEAAIDALAAASGFRVERRWTDTRGWFADVLLSAQ